MKYSLDTLSDRLSALALFRGVLETDVTAKLLKLIGAAEDKNPGDFYGLWGSFTSALYAEGGDLGLFVKESVLNDKNPYITSRLKGGVIGAYGVLELLVGATQLALHEGRRQI